MNRPYDPPQPPLPPPPLDAQVAMALGLIVENKSRWCRGQCMAAIADGGDFPAPGKDNGYHFHEKWVYYRPDPECAHSDCRTCGDWDRVPDYSTKWSATGPLIERFDLSIEPTYAGLGEQEAWTAVAGTRINREGDDFARAPTPLMAVCLLILLLRTTGELKRLL